MPSRISKRNEPGARSRKAIAALAAAATVAGGAATAIAAGPGNGDREPTRVSGDRAPVAKSTLAASVEAPATHDRYRSVYREAERLDVAPKRNLTARGVTIPSELHAEAFILRAGVTGERARLEARERKEREERRERRKERNKERSSYGTPGSVGVDQGTLDAIASCESGGDPTAVDASGTYRGKYQFDMGTWAGVGGSGDPAAAPEAEQDYRAALLYSQAGSSPWPVCGS